MKKNKFLAVSMAAVLSLTLVGCSSSSGASDNSKILKGEELVKIEKDDKEKENYLVIDIRDEASYKEGHLKHAINIPLSKIDKSIEEIRKWKLEHGVIKRLLCTVMMLIKQKRLLKN